MYLFKKLSDLRKVPPDHPCRGFVLKLVRSMVFSSHGYDPSSDGYAVLIEPQDLSVSALLAEVPLPLLQMPWEGVVRGQGLFHGVVLTNNQFAIDVIIPDAEWLSADVRKSMEEHL